MSYKAASLTRILLLSATCAPLLFAAACSTDGGPYPMPSGYAHHSDVYKAPDGPEMTRTTAARPAPHAMPVPVIEAEEPKVQAAVVPVVAPEMLETDDWQTAADTLVHAMSKNFGKPQVPVYVMPGKSIEEMSLAAALSNALLGNDINVSLERGLSPYTMSYMIVQPMDATDSRKMVKIMLHDHDKKIAEESGLFNIGAGTAGMSMNTSEPAPAYETSMEKTDPEVLRAREMQQEQAAQTRYEPRVAQPEEQPTMAKAEPAMSEEKVSTPPANHDQTVSRPRQTAMSKRLGGERISSEGSEYTAPAPYEDRHQAAPAYSAEAMEQQYQSRTVSMPVMDDSTENNTYGSAKPVPLTSSDDR